MLNYLIRRLLLIIPTLFVILTINFFIVQIAPGGPVDQALALIEMGPQSGQGLLSSGNSASIQSQQPKNESNYRGARGLDPQVIAMIEKQYGFDKPILERYIETLKKYILFDFGDSFFKSESVVGLIIKSLPVSISLGLWSTIIVYIISIPLGIRKAVKDGSAFDFWSSTLIIIGYAIPSFLLAILLIVLFAGGSYWDIFPLRGLISTNFDQLDFWGKVKDYAWHICLPTVAMVVGGFASLTMLTKNSFLDEIRKQYVLTARAKGLTERKILYRHVFRNATLLIVSSFPATFVGILFTGSLLIEIIFSLNGLGLLGYEAILQRDYPVIFGSLYIFTLIGLLTKLISDLSYMIIDPRIDFEARN
ncbi:MULTISPECIES: microcin C ABC transporter permease YejB [unclassified Gilliamella]|uniref:microcin C ABC transporter permease YejB n=1 Tax=unclassified Gilliamella TaxID=2685620 RepID=UPI002269BB85|nr:MULTISPECIES: microcin C ABC transporter permease YejB [unclassified Gilliamella]MCX8600293.1 microcin C ABC transporter permease YejB [Gilliamella sp. B3722]MCX8609289.1 microcin C ABC transporter permease YejB [Gilliamella sp. B3771]MCX8609508.1 microcin C ABC transporter permease YejB [Gilliamella sp. B3891]MCX8612403.1 microcin C ABC transporter permease YejB [Gilliamella sp. B3773]MCX8615823.1 microcin C ABC transporter permease YejB [Gilliamella sp. B3770]